MFNMTSTKSKQSHKRNFFLYSFFYLLDLHL